jgi:hypothetical protein
MHKYLIISMRLIPEVTSLIQKQTSFLIDQSRTSCLHSPSHAPSQCHLPRMNQELDFIWKPTGVASLPLFFLKNAINFKKYIFVFFTKWNEKLKFEQDCCRMTLFLSPHYLVLNTTNPKFSPECYRLKVAQTDPRQICDYPSRLTRTKETIKRELLPL